VFSRPGVVAVAGSRDLPASGSALVVQITSNIAACGSSFVVGCCSGADAALLSAVPGAIPPSLVRCLAAFDSNGIGAAPSSAVAQVLSFSACGGSVSWLAGGSASLPLWIRLANRTKKVINSADAGLVVFFSSHRSRGSLLACRCAVSQGLPILAFPIGFSGSKLPFLGAGSWVHSVIENSYLWVKNQQDIFI
jgi:predicted Rossmann fold nucleotide-binding protein DprA/Smf involved in DNA uptake